MGICCHLTLVCLSPFVKTFKFNYIDSNLKYYVGKHDVFFQDSPQLAVYFFPISLFIKTYIFGTHKALFQKKYYEIVSVPHNSFHP